MKGERDLNLFQHGFLLYLEMVIIRKPIHGTMMVHISSGSKIFGFFSAWLFCKLSQLVWFWWMTPFILFKCHASVVHCSKSQSWYRDSASPLFYAVYTHYEKLAITKSGHYPFWTWHAARSTGKNWPESYRGVSCIWDHIVCFHLVRCELFSSVPY